jgi:hypothetical protein
MKHTAVRHAGETRRCRMNQDRQTRTRALAAVFATAALMLVSGPRAAVYGDSGSS